MTKIRVCQLEREKTQLAGGFKGLNHGCSASALLTHSKGETSWRKARHEIRLHKKQFVKWYEGSGDGLYPPKACPTQHATSDNPLQQPIQAPCIAEVSPSCVNHLSIEMIRQEPQPRHLSGLHFTPKT